MENSNYTVALFASLLYKAIELESRSRFYATDVKLSSAEIYFLKIVHDTRDCHLTGVAEKLGVSKAAASQMLSRLRKKNLLCKTLSSENRSRYVLTLSGKGLCAHREHMRIERTNRTRIIKLLETYSPEERAAICDFLEKSAKCIG